VKLFIVECPIESCYVLADLQSQLLSKKKLLAGGRGDKMTRSYLSGSQ